MRIRAKGWLVVTGFCVAVTAGWSCREADRITGGAKAEAWNESQPLMIFEVAAGKRGKTDAAVESVVEVGELFGVHGVDKKVAPAELKIAELDDDGKPIGDCESQAEVSAEPQGRCALVWRLKGETAPSKLRRFGLFVRPGAARETKEVAGLQVSETPEGVVIANEYFRLTHPKGRNGGLPSDLTFAASGRVDNELRLNDRVHSKEIGGYWLKNDNSPSVRVIASGPIRTTVQVSARYLDGKGVGPESGPRATYLFSYSGGSPVITVAAEVTQASPFMWKELHFLELHHPTAFFPQWVVGDSLETGGFKDTKKGISGRYWGALFGPKDALGLFTPGSVLVYDGAKDYGTYLHGPWLYGWGDLVWRGTARLYAGPSGGSFEPVRALAEEMSDPLRVSMRVPVLERRIEAARQALEQTGMGAGTIDPDIALQRWRLLGLRRGARSGSGLSEAQEGLAAQEVRLKRLAAKRKKDKTIPAFAAEQGKDEIRLTNGTIGVGFVADKARLRLSAVYNGITQSEMLSAQGDLALWEVEFRNAEGEAFVLTPLNAGREATFKCEVAPDGSSAELRVLTEGAPVGDDRATADVEATVRMAGKGAEAATQGLSLWRIKVVNRSDAWGVWEVRFPQIQPAGEGGVMAYPSGWGVSMPVSSVFNFGAIYPSGSCAMQFGSFNAGAGGLYYAAHDGGARTKKLAFSSKGDGGSDMRMSLGQYPEGMGTPGKNYEQPFDAVIGVYRGGWFEASKIYRAWALKQKWCSKGRIADRRDVAEPIKKVALWAMSGGEAAKTIPGLTGFKERFGVPLATHWYNWHMIPFDHTYPEYFPPKPGFKEGVETAKKAGVLVMPYINGRLWDVEIPSFPREAMRYATRDAKGSAYIEQYGSKRMLAPMCPWTKFWQDKVGEIVWRLVDEFGVNGVYTDQVAAAAPRFCMDATHGHPLGGGEWWVQGYDKMLEPMRARMKAKHPDSFLTTESNAEPYIQHYDAYLMCNSTQGNLIPLFTSVYSDMILTFGRYTFESDAQDENAFYMKEGELFIFGGQLGWLGYFPADEKYKAHGDYLKALSECRERAQKWMALGEMLRPLEYKGEMPSVAGQWTVWRAKQRVELPAVMNSVWRAPDGTIGIALTNMSAKAVKARFEFKGAEYGLKSAGLAVSELTGKGVAEAEAYSAGSFERSEELPPRSARFLVVTERQGG